MKKIGILLKVFSNEAYKKDFLDGNLYMNTINFFRHYEEDIEDNIGDCFEALTGWLHPHEFQLDLSVNGEAITINPDDIVGPITISMMAHNNANVYCMTHLHSHDIDMSNIKSDEEYELLKEYFTLPEDVNNLGEHMVVITNPKEFVRRTVEEGKRLYKLGLALDYQSKQVVYYNESQQSLMLEKFRDAPFHKQSRYAHQNEYRLCLTRNNPNDEPFIMKIGDLRGMSMEIKTSEFNSLIELNKK